MTSSARTAGPGARGGGGGGDGDGATPGDVRVLLGLWPFVRPHRRWLYLSVALLPFITAASVGQTWSIKLALDRSIVPAGVARPLGPYLALILVLLLTESLLKLAHGYLMQAVGQKVMHDLRCSLVDRLQRAALTYHDANPTGRLLTRATSDIEALGEVFSSGAIAIAGDAFTILGITAAMLWLDAALATVVLAMAPLLALTLMWFRGRFKETHEITRARIARMAAHLAEALAGIEVLKVTAQEARATREYEQINREYRDAYWWSNLLEAGLYSAVELFGHVTVAGLVWMGGSSIVAGRTTFGTLVAFLRFAEDLFNPLRDASAKFAVIQSAIVATSKVLAVLAVPVEELSAASETSETSARSPDGPPVDRAAADGSPASVRAPARAPRSGQPSRGELVLESVRFAYDGVKPVLRDISVRIAPGERIAIVGPTGAGKTTLVKLLTRLYPLGSGRILLDGRSIADQPLCDLRREIAFLPQDVYLFSGTVEENVSLGREGIDGAAVLRACEAVGAAPILERLAGQNGGLIAERGANLSAGERQLLSCGRILLTDPGVVILDEATSSVDTFTEERIARALEVALDGRTTLIIAHRLATVRGADRILIIAGGRLVEEGTHRELLARGGLYARLHELQFARPGAPGAPPAGDSPITRTRS
jgi:ATP-binding cassette subfamily B protein